MNDLASKSAMCTVAVIGAAGGTLHVFWGILLLGQEAGWGSAAIALMVFAVARMNLGVHLSRLPDTTRMRFDEALVLFQRAVLPFCVPSAITIGLLSSSQAECQAKP